MDSPKALFLINIGTPVSPTPQAVGSYLKEFLMDPYVVDLPWVFRALLVYGLIVPRRRYASAKLYQKVWTKEGSPLMVYSLSLEKKLQELLGEKWKVYTSMRYGSPSILEALKNAQKSHCEEWVFFPLYPQYSLAANYSSEHKVQECLTRLQYTPKKIRWISPFYKNTHFIAALKKTILKAINIKDYDHLLFSYHGLPERQLKKVHKEASEYCLKKSGCCDFICDKNERCYRAHCFETSRLLGLALGLSPDFYTTCFQSRLGRTPWIKPYTDELYEKLPKKGIKKVAVIAPSFVVDCLETLEEIQIRGKEQFFANGGEVFDMIPCLNDSEQWLQACVEILRDETPVSAVVHD
jgi:ferrochelatase